MLTHDQLVNLYRRLRRDRVLTVYLDGNATDFAERKVWKRRLEQLVGDTRRAVNGQRPEEEESFNAAVGRIERSLADYESFLPDRGWVGFATADELVYGEAVRAPMPDLVRWEDGIRVAPYVRALKQHRLVVTVLVDSRRARVFEYRNGDLSEPEDLNAETFLGDLTDINVSKRATSRSGVRGKTGTDAAQRFLGVGSERMLKQLMHLVTERVGKSGVLVIGGTDEAVAAAIGHLPQKARDRVVERTSLHVEMSDAEIRSELEAAASSLNQSMQKTLLESVVDQARAGGRGALGPELVERTLKEGRVDTLLLSRDFIRANPDYADHLVGAAFEQHADVEELSGEGAEVLDGEGEGVAARLRYTLKE
jgi:hypothetical protein